MYRLLALMAALCAIGGLLGCKANSDKVVLKLGHTLDAGHPVHRAMLVMNERLVEISGGTMRIDLYPSGQLGSEREMMELLQIGSLAMTKVSTSPMENFVPEMKIFSLPYVFRDQDHFWRMLESDLGQNLLVAGEKVRLRGLVYYDAGSRSFYTTNKAIHAPDDLKSLKIRVQKSQTSVAMIDALGGSATPISWGELYTALQQGVVDGAENNPPSFYRSKHYEVSKYYTLDEHTYVPDMLIISAHIWHNLTQQQQQWLQQAADESVAVQRRLWAQDTAEALREVEAAGVQIIYPDKTLFADKVQHMHTELKGSSLEVLLNKIHSL
ncbi:TRAP transporter substrate-binding protein [Simiduia curdlanivorans]|uniref:TRAP transporter substrate-binding protein n=1 Tax=Simiduia curdlanivorans TaxID=1492769 RepID=A0ABV8V1N3_9GAMM